MDQQIWKKGFLQIGVLFVSIPITLYAIGEVPKRTLLKEFLSLLTLLAYSMMIAQFFFTRCNRRMFHDCLMSRIIKIHKVTGYFFMIVLLVHPFLIVIPRYFEAGIDPKAAFITIITNVRSIGVVTGLTAWVLMFLLGLTSLFRSLLFTRYTTWRVSHAILSVLFLICGSWHAIDLGRHMTPMLSSYLIFGALSGVLLLLRSYIPVRNTKLLQEVII